jgi:hypothetical protein
MIVECGPSVSENINVQTLTVAPGSLGKGLPVDQIMRGNVIPGITLIINMTFMYRLA